MSELSNRYAKSLIELSQEKGQLEEVNNDMRLLKQVCDSSREFVLMLRNPVILADKKVQILEALFKNKISKMSSSFFALVCKKNRDAYLPAIAESFIEQYNKLKHIVMAYLTTAVPVDDAIKQRIIKLVQETTGQTNIELRTKVVPHIIGGYILQFEDKQYDTTVIRNLEVLDDNFMSNIYRQRFS